MNKRDLLLGGTGVGTAVVSRTNTETFLSRSKWQRHSTSR